MPDWSLLTEELLHLISTYLENCFDVIHARSVCHPWRIAFPFPSSLLRPSYTLPDFADYSRESKELCTLEKVPLFLFITLTPSRSCLLSSFLGDKSDDHMVLPYPLQCSVEVKIPRYEQTLMNVLDCQILSLGHQHRMTGLDMNIAWKTDYRGASFLPRNNELGGEFFVLLSYKKDLLVLRSAEMKWMQINNISEAPCDYVVAFRGRFYVAFFNSDTFVIYPYSLEATRLMLPLEPLFVLCSFMVPSADDELFLVEEIIPNTGEPPFPLPLRVSKLDEKAGKWIVVSDLKDRVLFINGKLGNFSFSAKELPDCCGVNGNSVMIVDMLDNANHSYHYVINTGDKEDDRSCWRFSAYLPWVLFPLSHSCKILF